MGFLTWLGGSATIGGPNAAFGNGYDDGDTVDISSPADLVRYLETGAVTASGERVGQKESLANAAVNRSVTLLCGVVGGSPIDIKHRRTKELVGDEHSVQRLMGERPNSWQSPQDFKKLLQAWVLLRGNGYARKVRSRGRVASLLPLHPEVTRPDRTPAGRIVYQHTTDAGKEIELEQKDVFHVRGMTLDGLNGVSVITYAREAIGSARAAERHGASTFKNGTKIGGVVEHPAELGEAAFEKLKKSLDDFRGVKNAGRALILEEGMKYSPLGMTAKDAEFIATRKFSIVEIAMFFGVPPHMLGFTETTTSWGSGIEQQSIGFINYTLNDWFGAWEGAIKRDLLANEPGIVADFDARPLTRGDTKARSEGDSKSLQWGVNSPNEIRLSRGEPAREGGDIYYDPPNTAGGEPKEEIDTNDETK